MFPIEKGDYRGDYVFNFDLHVPNLTKIIAKVY